MKEIKCEVAKPDYNELCRENVDLNSKIYELKEEINALKWALSQAYKDMNYWKSKYDAAEGCYYKEHKRAEKLYEELNKNDN